MKLADYIASVNLTQAEFAGMIDVEQATVARYISGHRYPRPEVLVRIREATRGAVTANDFLDPPEPHAAEPRRVA